MRTTFWGLLLAAGLLLTACAMPKPDRNPVPATGWSTREAVHSRTFMVATANPHASQAAFQILKQGGTAADAAIAATLVLNLVEPQSSGLGGGDFILYWDQTQKKLHSYDGRETAPEAADENLFF